MYKIIGGDQTEYGPVSAEQLRQWIAEGRADANTHAQLEGTNEWKPLRDFPDFAGSFAATPAPSPTPLPSAGYPPPGPVLPVTDETGRVLALQQVNGPATGLMVAAVLGFLGSGLVLVLGLLGMGLSSMQNNNAMGMPAFPISGAAQVAGQVIGLAINALIFYGALKMRKLESYGLCMMASIFAMIPCLSGCGCLVGLPIGIWAVVVLNKPEIKQYFT